MTKKVTENTMFNEMFNFLKHDQLSSFSYALGGGGGGKSRFTPILEHHCIPLAALKVTLQLIAQLGMLEFLVSFKVFLNYSFERKDARDVKKEN